MNLESLEKALEREYSLPHHSRDDLIRELIWTHNRLQSFHPDCLSYVMDEALYPRFKLTIKVLERLTGFEITRTEMCTKFAKPQKVLFK